MNEMILKQVGQINRDAISANANFVRYIALRLEALCSATYLCLASAAQHNAHRNALVAVE